MIMAMSNHPLNLGLRFVLEIAAFLSIGAWGWSLSEGPIRFLWAIGLPLSAAAAWGTFRVPEDASASGKAPVRVPGVVRLGLEFVVFGLAIWALFALGSTNLAGVFAALVVIHYGSSYDRIGWLLRP
jgi:hypothetical protein